MKEKIERTFVREEAYHKLHSWIVEGTLQPGTQLRDKELAEKMGVSRTPIREALLRLEEEGLVKTKPNSSTQVSPIDFESAFHLYSIVSSLEQLAFSQAFEFITDQSIQKMIKANEQLLKALKKGDLLAALNADIDFHSVYIQVSQNKELEKILTALKHKLKRMDLHYFKTVKEAHLSYEEHQVIIEAIKKRHLAATLKAIENNWKESFSRFNPSGGNP
jgi:DNA-binding GntR family transcriptional regulator